MHGIRLKVLEEIKLPDSGDYGHVRAKEIVFNKYRNQALTDEIATGVSSHDDCVDALVGSAMVNDQRKLELEY